MAFAANLLENEILVVPGWAFAQSLSLTVGFCMNRPALPLGICSFSNVKMTNAQRQMPGGWGEWARLELTEPL